MPRKVASIWPADDVEISGDVTIETPAARLIFIEDDAGTDQGIWRWVASAEGFYGQALDDTQATAVSWVRVERSGTGTPVIDYIRLLSELRVDDNLVVGSADTTQGLARLYGSATANGGRLIVENAADSDTTSNSWSIYSQSGDFTIVQDGVSTPFTIDTARKLTYSADFEVTGDTIIATKTPASASATGTQGEIAWDGSYIYICSATNTWLRASIATW